jgi:hypothetical protein
LRDETSSETGTDRKQGEQGGKQASVSVSNHTLMLREALVTAVARPKHSDSQAEKHRAHDLSQRTPSRITPVFHPGREGEARRISTMLKSLYGGAILNKDGQLLKYIVKYGINMES